MSKTFTTMQTNIGNMCHDTTTAFLALVGIWINDRYNDISRRHLWSELTDFSQTITTVADTADYSLESDFSTELFVANITNGEELTRYDEARWWKERWSAHQAGAIAAGIPKRYIILRGTTEIKLDPTPKAAFTIATPYRQKVTDLSGSTAPAIDDIEYILEYGALSEAFAYKRQFQKADYFLNKYEFELGKRIAQEKSRPNQLNQFISDSYRVAGTYRLLGEDSYDSL